MLNSTLIRPGLVTPDCAKDGDTHRFMQWPVHYTKLYIDRCVLMGSCPHRNLYKIVFKLLKCNLFKRIYEWRANLFWSHNIKGVSVILVKTLHIWSIISIFTGEKYHITSCTSWGKCYHFSALYRMWLHPIVLGVNTAAIWHSLYVCPSKQLQINEIRWIATVSITLKFLSHGHSYTYTMCNVHHNGDSLRKMNTLQWCDM